MSTSDAVTPLTAILAAYTPLSDQEAVDLERVRQRAGDADPWTRASALHVTGSAVILHPPSGRVLLRWHERMQAWLQVGGHADPAETDPFQIALREANEETGLSDLAPWPDAARPSVVQIVVVPVPAGRGEPAHEHADVRYVLATARPDDATPENAAARLRWLPIDEALEVVAEDNLRVCLARIAAQART
jgi:8-oxo-dGTP pyrophosphatase MutT (NUDIX family)